MNGRIKTGFPILDDILGGGVREGLVILRCEGVPCAWVAERIVENLHRNAPGADDVTTVREDAEQSRIDAHMTGRVAVAIRCGYEVQQETRYADLILGIKASDGGYDVRVVKHCNGRIGAGVALASDNGALFQVCALSATTAGVDTTASGGSTMKEVLGLVVGLAKASEFLRWETAMRGVEDRLDDLGQPSAATQINRWTDRNAEVLHARASAYAHAAEMLRAAIAGMKEGT